MPDSAAPAQKSFFVTGLAALGIVFGDLGTSPLYTYQAIVAAVGGHPSAQDAIGLLSLVVWALIVTVSIKYCLLVMRADYQGEGGILALMALVTGRGGPGKAGLLVVAGLFGAALIYGDGVITPAISVLSALEGINLVTDSFKPFVMPAALVVLVALFAIQTQGTARIGRIFGPVMLLWFATIAVLGAVSTAAHPEVLLAIDPRHAIGFLAGHGLSSFVVLGGVFLAITGGEALYADMGHLGRGPIRLSWYAVVLPALLLAYAGQTALLIGNPNLDGNPFFRMAPSWAVIPLVILATAATIIASQAIITGAFSLTRQAIQLGWFPRVAIRQTSDEEYGQIYVPMVNWAMMAGCLALTFVFGSSDRLAGAYGTAVSTTMLLTTVLLYRAMRDIWRWRVATAAATAAIFLIVDIAFFAANLLKIADGGWIPLVVAVLIYLVMITWHGGVEAVRTELRRGAKSQAAFKAELQAGRIARVPGTAVFLSRGDAAYPMLMVNHAAQMKALQETAVSLTVRFETCPRVLADERSEIHEIGCGIWQVIIRFGFIEIPNVATALAHARAKGCPIDLDDAVYFAARDDVVRKATRPRMSGGRRLLFGFMYRNAVRASDLFELPKNAAVDVGRQLSL